MMASPPADRASRPLTRRRLLGAAAVGAGLHLLAPAWAEEILLDVESLKPGEFTWHPERQPDGPVAVVVSLDQQRAHVYRNGVRIAVSTCSTGKPGHETPTGVFVVLQKDRNHRSSTYNGAPMPNMNRLTWDGIALHAGKLPGYPASHGCVRLPMAFSEKLFGVTHIGTPVIIASSHSDPVLLTHPGPILSGYAEAEMEQAIAASEQKLHPSDWAETDTNRFTTLVISSADGRAILLENDRQIDEGGATVIPAGGLGQHVFVLQPAGKGMVWQAISHHNLSSLPAPSDAAILNGTVLDRGFTRRLKARMHPGMVMILTDTSLSPQTRSAPDFVILNTDDA
jgi:L,D-transpeptidase catalytic domain